MRVIPACSSCSLRRDAGECSKCWSCCKSLLNVKSWCPALLRGRCCTTMSKGEEHYNDNAANWFILFVISIIGIPSTFVFLRSRLFPVHEASERCACSSCKQKEETAKAKASKGPSISTILKSLALVVLWVCFVYVFLNTRTATEQPAAGYFDPYAILGLEPVCTTSNPSF